MCHCDAGFSGGMCELELLCASWDAASSSWSSGGLQTSGGGGGVLTCSGALAVTPDGDGEGSSGSATFSGVYFPSSFADFAANLKPFIPSAECLLEGGVNFADNPFITFVNVSLNSAYVQSNVQSNIGLHITSAIEKLVGSDS